MVVIGQAPSTSLTRFLQPLIDLRHTLPQDSTLDDLIVANVKKSVESVANCDVRTLVYPLLGCPIAISSKEKKQAGMLDLGVGLSDLRG